MTARDAAMTARDPVVTTGDAVVNGATPLLLYPVRIETRFADTGGTSELWVRVYPDQIMVNGHHPELTSAEQAAGNDYWNTLWLAGNPPP